MLNRLKHDCFGASTLMFQEAEAKAATISSKRLDYSIELSEGDRRMAEALQGDFCRRCGQKLCRCVDYSVRGGTSKAKHVAWLNNAVPAKGPLKIEDVAASKKPRIALNDWRQ